MPEVPKEQADIAWFLYDLIPDPQDNMYHLTLVRVVYTEFTQALNVVTTPKAGDINIFMNLLQNKLDEKQEIEPEKPKTIKF